MAPGGPGLSATDWSASAVRLDDIMRTVWNVCLSTQLTQSEISDRVWIRIVSDRPSKSEFNQKRCTGHYYIIHNVNT